MAQKAIITENSGNGPTYNVHFVNGLKEPADGKEWQLIVDGGPICEGAVIVCIQVPKT